MPDVEARAVYHRLRLFAAVAALEIGDALDRVGAGEAPSLAESQDARPRSNVIPFTKMR